MKVGIIGASGYVGGEVVRLLLSHPEAEVSMVTSTKHVGEYLHRIHPSLKGFTELTFSELDYDKMSEVTQKAQRLMDDMVDLEIEQVQHL